MTLIRSISGIRGTIGGIPGQGLTPDDVVRYTAAFATFLKEQAVKNQLVMILGRDARISGAMVNRLAAATLEAMGVTVVDIGLTTTPTAEMAVTRYNADGGIILTASHNPKQWNALKLLNNKGEFISAADGARVLSIAEEGAYQYADVDKIGAYSTDDTMLQYHIDQILSLSLVDREAIAAAGFRIAVDAVNSTGGTAIPALLRQLGVKEVVELNCTPDGHFAHNPEPLPENLREISETVVKSKSHLGIVVDPDVDRLALVSEDGEMFGEEYTLVAVADYILSKTGGNTVSNLSSTRALQIVTQKAGYQYSASAVGEVNVVEMMKATDAVIGGEGNGGIIYPALHYGRDALVGVALFLTHLAKSGKKCSMLRRQYPDFFISKNKIELFAGINTDTILLKMKEKYNRQPINDVDGVRIDFGDEWVHLRKSNTEPIIRIYAESDTLGKADHLASKIIDDIKEIVKELM
jgi:phosphomannomutase